MQEHEETRTCEAEDVTITVVDDRKQQSEVTVKVCPFEGDVMVRFHLGRWDWECPLCQTVHDGEYDID